MNNSKKIFTIIYKNPDKPIKTPEELVSELVQSTIQKVLVNHERL